MERPKSALWKSQYYTEEKLEQAEQRKLDEQRQHEEERERKEERKLEKDRRREERGSAKRNPLLLLLAGAGIVAIVLVVLIVAAISNSKIPVTQPPAIAPGATRISEKDGMVMVYVPAGEFLMGSADSDKNAQAYEKPQHTVYLDAYWIDRTEVTNAQYKKCVQAGKCTASSYASESSINGDTQPVVGVDWNDAKTYCGWAGAALPTEAQWEKAARGTDGRLYPWGEQAPTQDLCNFGRNEQVTTPVGKYSPQGDSPYGCVDMAGNVWEWVADWYDANYYASSPSKNPTGPWFGQHIVRGGSWMANAPSIRAATRSGVLPVGRGADIGFRCVGSGPGG